MTESSTKGIKTALHQVSDLTAAKAVATFTDPDGNVLGLLQDS
jgi:hypothetical protein